MLSIFNTEGNVVMPSSSTYLHQLSSHWLDVLIEEVGLEIVHTELESTETLTDEGLRTVESRHQGIHQEVEVRKERAV